MLSLALCASLLLSAPSSALTQEDYFHQGRANIEKQDYEQAITLLSRLSSLSPYYYHAVRMRLFAAAQLGDRVLLQQLKELCLSPDSTTRRLARVGLLERTLSVEELQEATEKLLISLEEEKLQDEFSELLLIYRLEWLSKWGDADAALSYGRELENNKELLRDSTLRQRIRLILAEVYYAQAAESDGAEREQLRGKAEETLLQFIAAQPDSILLEDAFLLLSEHRSLRDNPHVKSRLLSWIAPDVLHYSRRSALALQTLFYIEEEKIKADGNLDLSYVNMALSAAPDEPSSKKLLTEATRRLLLRHQLPEAEQYIKLMPEQSAYKDFFQAEILFDKEDYKAATDLFLKASKSPVPALRDPARINAFLSALRSNQYHIADSIESTATRTEEKCAILRAQSAHYLNRDSEKSRRSALELLSLYPDDSAAKDVRMDLLQLALEESKYEEIEKSLEELKKIHNSKWTQEQNRRYFALRALSAERFERAGLKPAPYAINTVRELLDENEDASIDTFLTLFLGDLLMDKKRFADAIALYIQHAKKSDDNDGRARAYLLAGMSSERRPSLNALKKAIQYYQQSSKINSIHREEALIRCAKLYVRIGEEEKARTLLQPLLDDNKLSPKLLSLAHSVLADAWAHEAREHKELIPRALQHSAAMLVAAKSDPVWLNRARLHHAHLCGRFGQHYEALDTLHELINELQREQILTRAEWYIYYHGTSSAIIHHLAMKQYQEAAQLAEQSANWVESKRKSGDRTQQLDELEQKFRQWGSQIRQSNFISS